MVNIQPMGFLDSVKAWMKTEAAEAQDLGHETKSKLEADTDRREADLNLTPQQRMEQLQDQIAEGDSTFEHLQDKIDGREALAGAKADMAEEAAAKDAAAGEAKDQAAADVLDLESEEVIPPEPPPA